MAVDPTERFSRRPLSVHPECLAAASAPTESTRDGRHIMAGTVKMRAERGAAVRPTESW